MLTLKTISENPELVIKKLAKKHFDGKEVIEKVLEIDQTRKKTQTVLDAALSESNTLSKHIGQLMKEGKSLIDATLTAAKLRLRPILMTSLAFTLGVVPLMLASGASDSTQHAIGTGVFGGMISGTLLAIFFVPVFFVTITRFTGMRKYRLGNSRNG